MQLPIGREDKHVLAASAARQPPPPAGGIDGRAQEADACIGWQIEFVPADLGAGRIDHDHGPPAVEGDDPHVGRGVGRIEADEVARQRHAGRPPCRFELESHGLSPRSDHLLGQPRSRASAGSPIEFASIVGQPPFVPRADERPGRCRGVGGREALGDVAGDPSVVARDHIGHRTVGCEDDRGWKRLQRQRLR